MSILSDFFISDDPGVPTYDGGSEFPAEDRRQFRRITPLEAAGILTVLRGGGDQITILKEFPILTDEDAEAWIMRVPVDMASILASLDESQLSTVAQRCAEVTAEELGWGSNEFEEVVRELSDLARRAIETGKTMYLWNCL